MTSLEVEFKIQYRDPDTDRVETLVVKFFNDTEDDAKMRAENYARALAGGRWYDLSRIK